MRRTVLEATLRTLALLLLISAPGFADEIGAESVNDDQTRLLIVVESDSRLPVAQMLVRGIEAELGPEFTTNSEIYIEYLDMLRFNDPREVELNRRHLADRYSRIGLNAVGVLGGNALAFLLDNRDAIAPGAPVVYGGLGEAGLATALNGREVPDLSGIISPFDFRSTLDLALTVQPDAPEIVVIAGSANFDRQWRATVAATVGDTYRDVPLRVLPEATADDYLAQAALLDPASIVLLLSVNLDAAGRRFLPVQFAKALADASAAPVWSLYETQIGVGIVGGHVENLDATGREIGAMLRMAVDRVPLPQPFRATALPTVDWRAMTRHDLETRLLPANSRVLFYEPTFLERYWVWIMAVATIVLAQTATILALTFQRRRYLRTQASLDSERGQLIHVSRNLRLGQLSASLAHEINQPLAAIQANAEAGTRLSARRPPDLDEISAIFRDINDDVRRASSTITGLRRLMVKGEVAMAPVDLNEVVRDTVQLVQNELSASGAQVKQALSPDPVEASGNAPQLQQVVLNLVFNALEAMSDLPEAVRIVRVTTANPGDGRAILMVEDAGSGIPPDKREKPFRPFVSSKSSGLGVGLSICRNIAEAHGGTLAFADPDGVGARIVLTLPARRASG